ncbi:UPF0280 family protein [Oceanibium sediminis]|uniref:UPF0280 family protein n=1 Tax=Oceanibium sediminis TaxID=2026339 RepID=UPI000DD3C715|nr:UPF0280 family protein [Oceanibium sediminis]
MERATLSQLSGGRLHLHHGPIDVILKVTGPNAAAAMLAAVRRFESVLEELAGELPDLRRPAPVALKGAIARRMAAAVDPLSEDFITPMAAVAGAVADTLVATAVAAGGVTRAYANNGGDIALHLDPDQHYSAAIAGVPGGTVTLAALSPVRGVATSGWKGRSHSLGIADAVTVLAASAARADAAATMIANATDAPDHPAITRVPACTLSPDSDLGARPVTRDVPLLDPATRAQALERGLARARRYLAGGLIDSALIHLQGETRTLGHSLTLPEPETANA